MSQDTRPSSVGPALNRFLAPGRWWLLGFMLVGAVLFAGLARTRGYERAWHAWGIVSAPTPFLDFQVIAAGAESRARGLDPLYDNPRDPMQRRMNYPRVWQGLFALGLTQQHTVPVGIAMVALFLIGVLVFPRRIDAMVAAGLALTLFSPAVMLCLERGNIDLLLFALAALALLLLPASAVAATAVLVGGFVLKFYPILGLVVLLRENRRRFLLLIAGAGGVAAAYLVWSFADLLAIRDGTPRQAWLSYGLTTTAQALGESLANAPSVVLVGARVLGVGLLLALAGTLIVRLGARTPATESTDAAAPNLDAFRLGAGLYAGTFLLESNFDYRMVFLLFAVPQLLDWVRTGATDRRWVGGLTLGAMQIALWQQLWKPMLASLSTDGDWWQAAMPTLLEQGAKCAVFSGCAYLLAASAPAWLGEWFAPWRNYPVELWRRFRFNGALVLAVLLLGSGMVMRMDRLNQDWHGLLLPAGGPDRIASVLLAQAIASGDEGRTSALHAAHPAGELNAVVIGKLARLSKLSVLKTAHLFFLGSVALTLAAVWLLVRRHAQWLLAGSMGLAALLWSPAYGADLLMLVAVACVVVGLAWATVLVVRGRACVGAPRIFSWAGAAILTGLALVEILGVGAAALGWLFLSLLCGGAACWAMGNRWPRPVGLGLAGVVVLLPPLGDALVAKSAGGTDPRGLVDALRELTPRPAAGVVVGGEALQFQLLGADRRMRVWPVPMGGDAESSLKDLERDYIGALIVEKGATLDPAQFTALCTRLNLDDTPTFEHPWATVYLSRFARVSALTRLLQGPAFAAVSTTAQPEGVEWPAAPRVVPAGAAPFVFPMITPRPVLYNLALGYAIWPVSGSADGLSANTESEIFVPVPPAAKAIRWEFEINSRAYQRKPGTDGVEFLLEGELPDGGRRQLFRRVLDPAHFHRDRGPQVAQIPFTPRPGERLIFRTLPNGNGAFDWSYIRRIQVE